MTTIKKEILDLNTFDGFHKLFCNLCNYYDTNLLAYEATEHEYRLHYGKDKYSDYQSWKSTMSYHLNKVKCK